jgi:hypothetical protein
MKYYHNLKNDSIVESHPITAELVAPMTAAISNIMKAGKVIRLYRCFACNHYFPILKMSSAACICRGCLKQARDKGRVAKRNQIDRAANAFKAFLREQIEAI